MEYGQLQAKLDQVFDSHSKMVGVTVLGCERNDVLVEVEEVLDRAGPSRVEEMAHGTGYAEIQWQHD